MPANASTATGSARSADTPPASHWGGVFAMSFGAFAVVASEFLPVSLLTPMARDLQVSEGMVGQGIAISGLFAVITSLSVSSLAGKLNRKALLMGFAALMGASGALIALAPGYLPFMVGRALIGVVIGGFWSMSAATAIRLVAAPRVPRALAIVNGGNALATVLAAPLGSYLGSFIGWRGAFLCLVPISIICCVWLWISLPSLAAPPQAPKAREIFTIFSALKNTTVAWGMAACGTFFMGQFILFTYIRPFLETVTRVDVTQVSLVLLVLGVSGFAGTVVIGRFLGSRMYATLMVIPALMALIAGALIPLGSVFAAVVVLLAFWGLLGTAAPVGWWSWVAQAMPHNAEQGGGLMVAVVQTCIALGSIIGGLLFDSMGFQSAFLASAAVLVVASLLAAQTRRAAVGSSAGVGSRG
ncbi:MFS transporter [Paenarthrobacter ilicis]|uniref:MFS family arabinose efflux permease n=1 Tax=Paenarthrobacter ilicis TaxID=43665 RepID=A0ABX0TJ87_9MICC|nr:MFS transporter [Paenarthrobacter ilicis]MBM7794931.1 putative MFS family arabinose efflux permease [Paenarthrobacter ilicis]NIJ02562.1 putative MFS family arabinose efflux permease [Paenarthrobacter ilicis]